MSDADRKLDPALAELLETSDRSPGTLSVLVGLESAPDDTELASLEAVGFVTRSVIGDIVTGSCDAGDLPRLAAMHFVTSIQGGRLQPEAGTGDTGSEGPNDPGMTG